MFVSFFVFTAGCKASGPPGLPLHPLWNPWNIQLSQGTGQGVSMTFNAASRLRSLEDRSAALGSSRCELSGMHSVPKSAVLPYASGVGGLSRRLLNMKRTYLGLVGAPKKRLKPIFIADLVALTASCKGAPTFSTPRNTLPLAIVKKPVGKAATCSSVAALLVMALSGSAPSI